MPPFLHIPRLAVTYCLFPSFLSAIDILLNFYYREGVMKLHDVYQRDPKLGDTASLSKQLEENAQTVNRLQQEIQKYEVRFCFNF